MFEVKTNARINSPQNKVWNCLVDTKSYSNWNNFITQISGEFEEGNQIKIKLQFPDNSQFTFKPICIKLTPNEELRWAGKWWFNWLFRGEHYFLLRKMDDETTELVHGEIFTGLLSNFFGKKHGEITYKAFEVMNDNLNSACKS